MDTYAETMASEVTPKHYKIIASKSFHHSNLILELCYDTTMGIWVIIVIQVNTKEYFSLWGMWLIESGALTKFNSIVL